MALKSNRIFFIFKDFFKRKKEILVQDFHELSKLA